MVSSAAGTTERPVTIVALSYQAPASCPNEEHFRKQLARALALQQPDAALVERELQIAIRRVGGAYRGSIQLESDERVLASRACGTLSRALALSAAMMLQAAAPSVLRSDPLPAADTAPARSLTDASPVSPTPAEHGPPEAASGMTVTSQEVRRSEQSTRWRWSTGAEAGVAVGLIPGGLHESSVFLGLESVEWGPSFRARYVWPWWDGAPLFSYSGPVPTGRASFYWQAVRVDACPLHWDLGHRFEGFPCVTFEGGQLRADAGSARHTVLQAGALARIRWTPIWRAFVELEVQVAVSLTGNTFDLMGASQARWSGLGGTGSASVGLTIP